MTASSFIADLHALTTDYADPRLLKENTREIALDFLSAGLDPGRCVIFKQSDILEHDRLTTLFGMFTPLGWLERVPTFKDQQAQLAHKELNTYGFLGYPLLQSADILLYKPDFVPVGADQVAHVELTREVARRFNDLYPGTFFMSAEAKPWEMAAILEKARKNAGEPKDSVRTAFSTHQLYEAAQGTKKLTGLWACRHSAGAAGAADAKPEAAGAGWPEDEQELRQPHHAERAGAGAAGEVEDDGDRPGAGAAG